MAKTKREFLIGALICSLIGTACLVVSLATENWITAEPALADFVARKSDVNYGLFFGSFERVDFFNKSNVYSLTSKYFFFFFLGGKCYFLKN